jgi:hypothetical protein
MNVAIVTVAPIFHRLRAADDPAGADASGLAEAPDAAIAAILATRTTIGYRRRADLRRADLDRLLKLRLYRRF